MVKGAVSVDFGVLSLLHRAAENGADTFCSRGFGQSFAARASRPKGHPPGSARETVKDLLLPELLEECGPTCSRTSSGTLEESVDHPFFQGVGDLSVGKAMEGYARTEFGILWETHRCRPNAYGHTWSPGGELPSGMLPGHAVSTCMDYGTFLSWRESFINLEDVQRTLRLFPDCGCADWHRPTCRIGLGRRAPGPAGPRPGVPTGTDRRAEWGWADVLRALPVRDWVCRRAPADVHRPTCQIGLGRRAPGPAGPRPGVPTCTGRRAELGRANVLRALPVRDRVCRRAPADVPNGAGPTCSGPCGLVH